MQGRMQAGTHHSLAKATSFARHSLADSTSKKMSSSSLANLVDIDRIIDDIKLPPHPPTHPQQHIAAIANALTALRALPNIVDEVRTIELLLESIGKKVSGEALAATRVRQAQSATREGSVRRPALSPVKQFEEGSRIVYANFSLREVTGPLETPVKRIDPREQEETDQMDKLNHEIMLLEKMLKAKGVPSDRKQPIPQEQTAKPRATPKESQSVAGRKQSVAERGGKCGFRV